MSDVPTNTILCGDCLKAPFPWFGGKSTVADLVWQRFGDVPNYVEPFFGSGAVLSLLPQDRGPLRPDAVVRGRRFVDLIRKTVEDAERSK